MELLTQTIILIGSVLSQTPPVYISLEQFLLLHFTILGIFVTLISITSVLTGEVRQDIIDKYYYRHWLILTYVFVLIASFCGISYLYYVDSQIIGIATSWVFFFLFLFTITVIIWYLRALKRAWLYVQIYKKFSIELTQFTGIKKQSEQIHSKTYFESIDDLIKNILHIEKTSSDFIEEASILKKIIIAMIATKNFQLTTSFFEDLTRIDNKQFRSQLIEVLYDLKFKFYEDLKITRFLQDQLFILLSTHFSKVKEFDAELNTSGLYLREFLDIRYLKEFEKTDDQEWLQNYTALISNTINRTYELCKIILLLDLPHEIKRRYLIEQLASLNKILEHYDAVDFYKEYYGTEPDKEQLDLERNLANQKKLLISQQTQGLKKKRADLFYHIMFLIERGELPSIFFEIALKIYGPKKLTEQYYQYEEYLELSFLSYDPFEGGVQSLPRFNYNKYRLIVSFYYYLNEGTLDIHKFSKENFIEPGAAEFKRELNSIDVTLITKYFAAKPTEIKSFQSKAIAELKKKLESIRVEEQKYESAAKLNPAQVSKFKSDFRKHMQDMQQELAKFMSIEKADGGQQLTTFFGFYRLFSVQDFIDSFYTNIYVANDLGSHIGFNLANTKLKTVLGLINNKFEEKIDKEIVVKDIYSFLTDEIKSDKDYFLFYNSDLQIYKIQDIEWVRNGIETARLKLNNSVVHFCSANIQTSLLFEKGVFKLKQYKQGYKDYNEPFFVDVNRLDDDKENKQLLKGKKIRSTAELGKLVKIRIAEKFEVERVQGDNKLIRLII